MKKKFTLFILVFVAAISVVYFIPGFSSRQKEKNKVEFKSESWGALQFLNNSRAYPYADIPADGYRKAELFYKTHFENQAARTSDERSSAWQSIGPNNIGGRTLAIALDPIDTATIWLGSASGGLWKSTTGGTGLNAWTYIPTGFPVRGVTSIAINPNNHNEIYIGTGETYTYASSVNGLIQRPTRGSVGIGILKTTDGGLTWTQSLNWSYNSLRGVWDFKINPLNPNIVYATTTEGVYKTNNAGATWNLSLNQLMVMDLEMDKVDTNIIYAGVGNGDSPNKGIYKTSNSGATWNVLTNGLPPNTYTGRTTITAYPGNNHRIMAVIGDLYSTIGVYESTDQGASWVTKNNPFTEILSYQGWYAEGLCYKSTDPQEILFGGVEVFRSQSSGDLLFRVSNNGNPGDGIHSDIHDIISNPLDPNKIYFATDGGLWRSDDFGDTYYECTEGYVTSQFYIGSASQQDPNLLLGGLQDNYSIQFTGTNYWFPIIGGDGSFNAIDPNNDQVQYASYQYLNVFGTVDNWNNWFQSFTHAAAADQYNNVAFVAPFILCPSNSQVMYAGTEQLWRSNDGGNNWFPVSGIISAVGEPVIALAVSATYEDSVFASTAPSDTQHNHLWRSIDGGQSFTEITGTLPDRFIRDIALNPNHSQEIFVALSGFGTGHIFKSTNGGNTWTNVSTALPDVPFHCVTYDPTNTNRIFAGSDLGVFVSINGGNTWTAFNSGIPEGAMVFDLVYSASDTSLVAFTHGYGAYKISLSDFSVGTEENLFVTAFTQTVVSNPSKDFIRLMINSGTESNAEFLLYDINGKSLSLTKHHIHSGVNEVTIDAQNFSKGIYFVRTSLGKENKMSKVMVE
jgi:photosystem II stability/assembly factor-like uncharacterized protein